MALIDKKVSEAYSGRDISSLSDRPNEDGLTAQDLKARFDQLGKEVIPKYNQVIDILVAGNIEEIMSAGQGINVIDVYDTYLEFITAHPTGNINDIYGVRVAPNVQTYIWSVASSVWKEFALIGDKDKIGNLVYTENNYITDGEEVTDSLDKLDIALKDVDDAKQPNLVSGTNIKTINGTPILGSGNLPTDWNVLNVTLTYASADSPTFVANTSVDLTSIISVGMKLRLTQTTVKYFIVTAITSTSITLYGGTDYTLANVGIVDVRYSFVKAPFGFPLNPEKWTVTASFNTNVPQTSALANTWYNLNSALISVPIGLWKMEYSVIAQSGAGSSEDRYLNVTLSTANNSQSNPAYSNQFAQPACTFSRFPFYKEFIFSTASKILLYLNTMSNVAVESLSNLGNETPTIIKAVCAYL